MRDQWIKCKLTAATKRQDERLMWRGSAQTLVGDFVGVGFWNALNQPVQSQASQVVSDPSSRELARASARGVQNRAGSRAVGRPVSPKKEAIGPVNVLDRGRWRKVQHFCLRPAPRKFAHTERL